MTPFLAELAHALLIASCAVLVPVGVLWFFERLDPPEERRERRPW